MDIYEPRLVGLSVGAVEPVTVAEAKTWAAIDTALDDAVIGSIITSARVMAEKFISRDLVQKDYKLRTNQFEADEYGYYIEIQRASSKALITSVTDYDGAKTIDVDWFMDDISGNFIRFNSPPSRWVEVEFSSLPAELTTSEAELLKSAIKVMAEQIYDNRANLEGDSDITIMDDNIKTMLTPLKRFDYV